jgi:AcrR family transcriptional regulator
MATRTRAAESAPTRGDREQALVVAAFNQIAERGFEGLRTREVAAEVGVNIATLHYYFPAKEDLVRAVVEHAMGRFRTTLAGGSDLIQHLRAVRRLLGDEPQLGAVMAELSLRSSRDPAIAAILAETYAGWQKTMRGLLRNAVREGRLKPELDSDQAAAAVLATLSAMMLPTMAASPVADQALEQLERWLSIN